MATILSNNTLLHAIQCVGALERFLTEFVRTDASIEEKGELGELIADFDSVIDNLSTVYEERRQENPNLPDTDALLEAFSQYTLKRKAG
ncbi:hypothetical protein V8J88_24710 [Massilia sp. W12]|uniref:hypothetical protein n=1 Tax=Massilia sp. W12 TaxID=3126507 RepID=UPI0030CC7855